MRASGVSLFGVLCLAHLVRAENDTVKSVYFSLILSKGEYGFRTWDATPAIDLALETIKNQQLLPGYHLTYEDRSNSKVKEMFCVLRGHGNVLQFCWMGVMKEKR